MSDPEDRRKFPRFMISLPVLFGRKAPEPLTAGAGCTHDLSEEGACLELPERLAAPSALQLQFQMGQGDLELGAVVVWAAVIRGKGDGVLHGVKFSDPTPDQQQALRSLLRSEEQARRQA